MDITLPKNWQELTDGQLRYLLFLLASGYRPDEVKAYVFFRFGNADPKDVTPEQVAAVLPLLDWLTLPPDTPVRLDTVAEGHKALYEPYCHGMEFGTWLALDNWYAGFLHHDDKTAMAREMAFLLYGTKEGLSDAELLGAAYWVIGLKTYIARRFPHLFKPVTSQPDDPGDIGTRLRRSMEAQIRALTGCDITKNQAVLRADMYDALTELNYQLS